MEPLCYGQYFSLSNMMTIVLFSPGYGSHVTSSPTRAGSSIGYTENIVRGFQFHSINSDSSSTYPITAGYDSVDHSGYTADCLHIGPGGPGGGE